MTPAFASWSDFFAMGDYASYVWLAIAISIIPSVVLIPHSTLQHRAILYGVAQQWVREAHMRAAQVRRETM